MSGGSLGYLYRLPRAEILEAIDKQEPKKPLGDLHSVPHYRCPRCSGGVKGHDDGRVFRYCHHCGQRLDWSNTPEEVRP